MALAEFNVALNAVGKLYEAAKSLRDIDAKLEAAKFRDSLADLLNLAADLKVTISDLKNQNQELENEIKSLKQRKDIRGKLTTSGGFYKLSEEFEGHKPGNYCSACFEKNGSLFPLTTILGVITCPSCKAHYEGRLF